MRTKWTKVAVGCLAVGLAVSVVIRASAYAQGVSGVNASFARPTISNKTNIPLATPRWSIELSKSTQDIIYGNPSVVTAGNNVLFVKSGVLNAINESNGKTQWTFGKKLQMQAVAIAGNDVLVFDDSGVVYRVDTKSGKGSKLFQLMNAKGTKPDAINMLMASEAEGIVYVLNSTTVAAVDLTSGKLKWRNDEFFNTNQPQLVNGKLLFYAIESGALTVGTTYAIDPKTGKTLWRLAGSHSALLGTDGDKLYFEDQWPNVDDAENAIAKLDVVSLTTGELIESKSYPSPQTSTGTIVQRSSQIVIDGNDLYIGAGGSGVYRYGLQADPTTSKPAYISVNGSWIAGPYNGKLYFSQADNMGLFGNKLLDHTYIPYDGVDNPISRLDLIDSGMYIGQTDGSILAYNVKTGKAQFRYESHARNYGPFQTAGNTLIVQADNKLYGFLLSAELTKPITDAEETASGYARTAAKLSLNGELREFTPSMMTAANRMFVPFRFLTEALGAQVVYDSKTKSATVTYEERVFTITEGKAYAEVGGTQQELSFAPVTLNGSLYVSVKDIGNLLGITVNWNQSTRTVEVVTGK
ncbi:outer membrane protein assembly factor BamB [Paenibacillus cellulosilyticus]|uniref:Outer membrane protein assembly factor BamB n=1 Tax=Paenibacillus cellulosilyticus TaxID=375489 RepID=A0A2V2YPF8_9BACL|nr:stalk domain-containing protein [Paenibacillus cellulosilyticus]PWV95212.1 outer membrane protein assembly factor BamB [Paenibacillus cellulosilyticus]QKS46038.1 PQQ-binding-like beta-propeller repeat protein [Paenibacillus cellulosilyticus]